MILHLIKKKDLESNILLIYPRSEAAAEADEAAAEGPPPPPPQLEEDGEGEGLLDHRELEGDGEEFDQRDVELGEG